MSRQTCNTDNDGNDGKNLWAPWRMKYIKGLDKKHKCFICHYIENPDQDRDNYVLWRTDKCIVIFNRYPYNNGHLLVAPKRHFGDLSQADDAELMEMSKVVQNAEHCLGSAVNPHGFNIGLNLGRCAGAGLPEHMHWHIVPRWDGDTNYMAVIGETDVISQSLDELYDIMLKVSKDRNLPSL